MIHVCSFHELDDGGSQTLTVAEHSILLCRAGDQVYAIENRCTHQDTPLAGGRIRRGFIACPLHGVMFNLATGEPSGTLTKTPLRTYQTQIEDDQVYINIEEH